MTDRFEIAEAVSPEHRQVAYSIRFRSYRAIGEIDDGPEPFLSDPYDGEDHYKVFLLHRNGSPVATIRVGIYAQDYLWKRLACFRSFPAELSPYIGSGQPLVEAGRMAIVPELRSTDFSLVSMLFECVHRQAEGLRARWILLRARREHVGFWHRIERTGALGGEGGFAAEVAISPADRRSGEGTRCTRPLHRAELSSRQDRGEGIEIRRRGGQGCRGFLRSEPLPGPHQRFSAAAKPAAATAVSPRTGDPRPRDEPRDPNQERGGHAEGHRRREERGERLEERADGPADDRQDGDHTGGVAGDDEPHRHRTPTEGPDRVHDEQKEPRDK